MDLNDNELEEWGSFLEKNDEESLSEKLNDIDSQEPDDEQEEENEPETDTEDEYPEEEIEEEEKPKKAKKKPSKKPEKESEPEDDDEDEESIESVLDDEEDDNFFQTITDNFVKENIFSTIDSDRLKGVKSLDDFNSIMNDEINERIRNSVDNIHKRVVAVLEEGGSEDVIRTFEKDIKVLKGITDDMLDDSDDHSINEKNKQKRHDIIVANWISKGFSEDKAEREYKKSVAANTDIEDAKEARDELIEMTNKNYTNYYNDLKRQNNERAINYKKSLDNMRKSIDEDKFLDSLKLTKEMKYAIFANGFIPSYKDKNGRKYTALQAFQQQNPWEYDKMVSVFFTLTNGGRDFGEFLKYKIKDDAKKERKDIERKLRSTSSSFAGGMKVVGADTSKKKSKDIIDILNMGDFKFENNF